jgi:MOSC domain-containing protein YiiM
MQSKVISVNTSKDKGEKKHNVGSCRLLDDFGLENDGHAGPGIRQVSLLAMESIEKIRRMGLNVVPGDFAENLTTEGIDLPSLPIGTGLRVGTDVRLRITKIGKECHARCAIFQQVGDCVMPREGIFAQVVAGGNVRVGDTISVEE